MSQQDPELQAPAPPEASAPPVEAPVAQPAERTIDPSYVAQLEAAYRQQQAELNKIAPLADDINWMLEDENRRDGIKRYRKSYEEASRPQYDPAVEPVVEFVKNEMAPVRAYITRQEQAEQARQKAETDRFVADNVAFANRLIAEKKIAPAQVDQLAAYADSLANRYRRNVTIEEAYKDMASFGGGPKTEAAAAPVLRADAGAVGVPGPSQSDTKEWLTNFNGKLVDTLRAAQKTA